MIYTVQVSALAIEDLVALHQWVDAGAGRATVDASLDLIEERITSLADFPGRGTPRDHLVADLRTLTFERQLLIAYMVDPDVNTVNVLRIINEARDLGPLLGN